MTKEPPPGWYKTIDTPARVDYEFLSHDEKFYGICGFRLLPGLDKGRLSQKWFVKLLLTRRWRHSATREEFLRARQEESYYRSRDGLFGMFSASARCEELMAKVSKQFYLDRQLLPAASPAAQSEKAAVRRYDDGRGYGR